LIRPSGKSRAIAVIGDSCDQPIRRGFASATGSSDGNNLAVIVQDHYPSFRQLRPSRFNSSSPQAGPSLPAL